MTVSFAHPIVSRVWAAHDEFRQALETMRSIIADRCEAGEEGSVSPPTEMRRIQELAVTMAGRLEDLRDEQESDHEFASALTSKARLRNEWSRLGEERASIEHSLNRLVELFGDSDGTDSASWLEIKRQFSCCYALVTRFLSDQFDIIRRGLEWHEP